MAGVVTCGAAAPAALPSTAAEVKAALRVRHPGPAWVAVEEAFSGFARRGGGIDLLALGVWISARAEGLPGAGRAAPNPIVAYEVKVSRSDFRRELYGYRPGPTAYKSRPAPPWPQKQLGALEASHYFMFAVPKGLLTDEEVEQREPWPETLEDAPKRRKLWLPAEAGLVEVDSESCRVRVPAPRREDPPPLDRHEVAELVRYALAQKHRGVS